MGRSVVVKKEEKVNHVFELIGKDCTLQEFREKFIEEYPKDWERIKQVFFEHEKKDVKHKGHPMPHPDKYMENMYKIGKKKL
jgi:hypothetical protein